MNIQHSVELDWARQDLSRNLVHDVVGANGKSGRTTPKIFSIHNFRDDLNILNFIIKFCSDVESHIDI